LTDPFLARLPAGSDWHVGHYRRKLPDGYAESILSDTIVIKDPDLAVYYGKLRMIVRGKIFSLDRLREIWRMNIGGDDYLLEKYRSSIKSVPLDQKAQ
jgi:arabinofuranosyltransferase